MSALTTIPMPDQQLADPQTVYRHLERVRAEHGYVPTSMLDYWAELAGKSARTLQHWLTTGSAPTYQRPRFSLDERLRQLYFDCRGNVSLVHRKAREENLDPPSRETLSRRFRDEMTPFERAFASSGDGGARRHTIKLHADDPPHRWYCQQVDHFRLDTLVVPKRGMKPTYIWLTVAIDTATRWVTAVASLRPDQSTVLALMRKVVQPDPETGVGGIPNQWVWDNGLEFLSDAVTRGALTLDSLPLPTEFYSPWQKGRVERFGRTLTDELLADLPGWSKGPRTKEGKVYLPRAGALAAEELLLTLDERLRAYNIERPHAALDGQAPLQSWHLDPTPVRQATEEQLRGLALPAVERKINPDGIHHDGELYWAPELNGLAGERVVVGYIPGEKRWVEVWRGGVFLCIAIHESLAGEADRERLMAERRSLTRRTKTDLLASLERAGINAKRYGPIQLAEDGDGESGHKPPKPKRRRSRPSHSRKPQPRLGGENRSRDDHVLPDKQSH